jgi:signal transduction histidine kinase
MFKKIIVFLVFLISVVLITVFLLVNREIETQVRGIVARELNQRNDQLIRFQKNFVAALTDEDLRLVEDEDFIQAVESKEYQDIEGALKYFSNRHKELNIDLKIITDNIGTVIYTNDYFELIGRNMGSRDQMKYSLNGTIESGLWMIMGNIYIFSVSPLFDKKNQIIGTIMLGTLLDDEYALEIKNTIGCEVSIFYSGGFLGSSLPAGLQSREVGVDAIISSAMKKTKSGIIEPISRLIDEEVYLALYSKVQTDDNRDLGNFVLYLSLDYAKEMAMRPIQKNMLIIALMALLAAVGVGYFYTRSITNPLARLIIAADKVAHGDYDYMFKLNIPDEVGILSYRFDTMRQELKKQMKALQDFNRSLEEKVNERTEKLTKTLSENVRLYEDALKRTDELRIAHRESQEASRLKSEFLANMSHELRTPLSSILSLSEILLSKLDGPLTREQEKQVKIINRSGQMLLNLINDVLDMAKIESGNVNVNCENFLIKDSIVNIVGTIESLAAEKNIELITEIGLDVPEYVFNDEYKIQQIVLNLLSNAVKFTKLGWVKLKLNRFNQQLLVVEVTDTGIGIRAEHHQLIFQEFRQVDGSTTRKYGGSGLGLAICKNLVELIGGKIWVESDGRHGSTFSFTFDISLNPENINNPAEFEEQPKYEPK